MTQTEERKKGQRMEITVKGHKVTLHFADEPNPDVATQVKKVLLSACLLAAER